MTKHALLIGVSDEHPEQRFEPAPSIAAMEGLLRDLGGWELRLLIGAQAARDPILAQLDEYETVLEAGDAFLFYFVGHGGVVRFRELEPPLGGREVHYLATARPGQEWSFEGLLDVELSAAMNRLDARCGNVSVLLDCCYSARVVRSPVFVIARAPAWLRELDAALERGELHPTSHRGIVRLSGSTAYRESYPERVEQGHLGRLTALFVATLREAGDALSRLSWDSVAHRVRERAIWALRFEGQWINLAGPRGRLVFSTREQPLPMTVGFIPHEQGSGGWIRAGQLQGVALGDEWGLAELTADADLRPRWRAHMRVAQLGLNRARLEPVAGAERAPVGAAAHLLRRAQAWRVELGEGARKLAAAVESSAWLSLDTGDSLARVSCEGDDLVLRSSDPLVPACRVRSHHPRGLADALTLLEDWARTRALLAVVADAESSEHQPLSLRLAVFEQGLSWLPPNRARVYSGDRLVLELTRLSGGGACFVSVVMISADDRPRLFDESEPDGRELFRGQRELIAYRPHARSQGVELSWPLLAARDHDALGRVRLVVLVSERPLQLGHLCAPTDSLLPRAEPSRGHMQRPRRGQLAQPRPRAGPELTRTSAALVRVLELSPLERSSSAAGEVV